MKRGNRDPIAGEKAKEITAGCSHSSLSNPPFIHPFLPPSLPATPKPFTLQRAALMSNITHTTVAARAVIIYEGDGVRKLDDSVS